MRIDSLCRKLSYRFRNRSLLRQALTHRSYLNEDGGNLESNERLEFLGDAVLGMIITDELFQKFSECSEGELTKIKSNLVCRSMLAKKAREICLGDYLYLSVGEEKSGGRNRESILANTFEALLGAMFLDGGFKRVRNFVHNKFLDDIENMIDRGYYKNYKSWLLEYLQARGKEVPRYRVRNESGPDHRKEFEVEVVVDGVVMGVGRGKSKKMAEQEAASRAIDRLGLDKDNKIGE